MKQTIISTQPLFQPFPIRLNVGFLPAYMQDAVTDCFGNSAGFAACLCVGLPFAVLWLHDKRKWVRFPAIMSF